VQPNPEQLAARRQLGAELRRLREQAYRSGQDVAGALGWSQSKVSRIEQARTLPTVEDVRSLLRELRVPAPDQGRLVELAEEAAGEPGNWRNWTGAGLTRRQQDFVALERSASSIRHYQPILIPGYMQTEPYAREVLEMSGVPNVERGVQMRVARRQTLTGSHAPEYRILLMETALRWRPIAPELMAEQLTLVAELAERPNVELRIVTLDRKQDAYLQHPCMIFDFDGTAQREALVETLTQDIRVTETATANLLARRLQHLANTALAPSESLSLVRAAAQSFLDSRV
jgi:transcriptional regulator with XRE-family HTH domain